MRLDSRFSNGFFDDLGKLLDDLDDLLSGDIRWFYMANLDGAMTIDQATTNQVITIVGAGLAGSECALQLAQLGYQVVLYEMRPEVMTPAHKTGDFAELVCSNSFGSQSPQSATGQLKNEAAQLHSFLLNSAVKNAVPAGQALGVHREGLSQEITQLIRSHPKIKVIGKVVPALDTLPRPLVIATGPLTHPQMAESLQSHFGGDFLYFFDAIAPIVDSESINLDIAWRADRYDKGTPDYLNCPLNKEEYFKFVVEILNSRKIEPKDFEKTPFFEGCMPIETMVERGPQTLRFGPMKPVGLKNPKTGREPYAVVQLRQENPQASAFNMVGFQTRMAYPEQERIFRTIPGLEKAEFLKLGSMHRNLFINSPAKLSGHLSSLKDPGLFFAGQITGVEGYFESICTGLLVACFVDRQLKGLPIILPPVESAMGALLNAITEPSRAKYFQPTNINFSLFPNLTENNTRDKTLKRQQMISRAQSAFANWAHQLNPSSIASKLGDKFANFVCAE